MCVIPEKLKQACLCFICRLENRYQKINLRDQDWEHWFDSAYNTTKVRKGIDGLTNKIDKNTRTEVSELFRGKINDLHNITVSQFDDHHKKWIDGLNKIIPATVFWAKSTDDKIEIIGRSQKWINIFLKYYFTRYHAEIDTVWNKDHEWIRTLAPHFKAPVDFNTIKCAKRLCKKRDNRFWLEGRYLAWTKDLKWEDYKELQSLFKKAASLEFGSEFGGLAYETVYVW